MRYLSISIMSEVVLLFRFLPTLWWQVYTSPVTFVQSISIRGLRFDCLIDWGEKIAACYDFLQFECKLVLSVLDTCAVVFFGISLEPTRVHLYTIFNLLAD